MELRAARPLHWVGASRDSVKSFPDDVQDHIGFALYQAQIGLKHRDAKPLPGLGSGVIEIVSRFGKGAWRAVYTVRYAEAVYVLHAFQKKSKRGIKTPQAEMELVRQTLSAAERHYRETYGEVER